MTAIANNVLLIDPGFFPHHKREGFLTKYADMDTQIQTKPPLGLLSIASYLNANGIGNIRVVDAQKDKVNVVELHNILDDFQPDIVGVTIYTYRLHNAVSLIREIKKWNKNTHICVGGPHTLIYPRETLRLECVDSIVVGDGELPFYRLCAAYAEHKSTPDIEGLYFASLAGNYQSFPRYTEYNLDELPLLNPGLIKDYIHTYKNFMNGKPTMTLVSSRGCPFKCNYCIAPDIPYRSLSAARLLASVKYYVGLGYQEMDFYDDTFNVDLRKVEEFARGVIRENLHFSWSIRGARVSNMSKDLLKLLKQSGLTRMQFGVESGSDRILKELNKNLTTKDIVACFDSLRAVGIETIANIMIFCPTEKEEETRMTENLIHRIKPTFIAVQVFVIVPPMRWYYEQIKAGVITHDVWLDYVTNPVSAPPTVTIRGINNADDLFRRRDAVVIGYYFRFRYIVDRLIHMRFNEITIYLKFGWVFMKQYIYLHCSHA